MRLFFFSNGTNSGFAENAAAFLKQHGKGMLRIGKRIVDEETEIPAGFQKCADDETAIEKVANMRSLIRALTP